VTPPCAAAATPFVTNINYDAKRQRALIAYGNSAQTHYEYDRLTFRLTRLRTTRPAGLNGLASQLFTDPAVVQDLRYTYDPVGNFKFMRHSANGGSWTRGYEYDAASLIEPAQKSNRLTKTTVGNGTNFLETYTYTDAQGKDVDGCITAINSMKMVWDSKDQ